MKSKRSRKRRNIDIQVKPRVSSRQNKSISSGSERVLRSQGDCSLIPSVRWTGGDTITMIGSGDRIKSHKSGNTACVNSKNNYEDCIVVLHRQTNTQAASVSKSKSRKPSKPTCETKSRTASAVREVSVRLMKIDSIQQKPHTDFDLRTLKTLRVQLVDIGKKELETQTLVRRQLKPDLRQARIGMDSSNNKDPQSNGCLRSGTDQCCPQHTDRPWSRRSRSSSVHKERSTAMQKQYSESVYVSAEQKVSPPSVSDAQCQQGRGVSGKSQKPNSSFSKSIRLLRNQSDCISISSEHHQRQEHAISITSVDSDIGESSTVRHLGRKRNISISSEDSDIGEKSTVHSSGLKCGISIISVDSDVRESSTVRRSGRKRSRPISITLVDSDIEEKSTVHSSGLKRGISIISVDSDVRESSTVRRSGRKRSRPISITLVDSDIEEKSTVHSSGLKRGISIISVDNDVGVKSTVRRSGRRRSRPISITSVDSDIEETTVHRSGRKRNMSISSEDSDIGEKSTVHSSGLKRGISIISVDSDIRESSTVRRSGRKRSRPISITSVDSDVRGKSPITSVHRPKLQRCSVSLTAIDSRDWSPITGNHAKGNNASNWCHSQHTDRLRPRTRSRSTQEEIVIPSEDKPEDLCIIAETFANHRFNPPSDVQCQQMCDVIGIRFEQRPPFGMNGNAGKVTKTRRIAGDGNCLFRALSYAISGSQRGHAECRNRIVKAMQSVSIKRQLFRYLGRSVSEYISDSGMNEQDTWATDVEIMTAAALLQTDVFVYSAVGSDWSMKGRMRSHGRKTGCDWLRPHGPDGTVDEWGMVELQGSLETRHPVPLSGKFIGDLHFTHKDVPVLIIGHHILYGKVITLEKPFGVMVKNGPRDGSQMDTGDQGDVGDQVDTGDQGDTENQTEYTIQAVIRKKLLFKTRPKPIIANVPKKI